MSIHYSYILLTLFGWPAGIVLGNLLASLLWVPLQWAGMHMHLRAHHAEVHARLDDQDAVLENQNLILSEIRRLLQEQNPRSEADLQPGEESS